MFTLRLATPLIMVLRDGYDPSTTALSRQYLAIRSTQEILGGAMR